MEQIILFGNLSSDTVCHQLGYLQLHRMIFLLCEVAGIPGESMGNKKYWLQVRTNWKGMSLINKCGH